MKIIDHSLSYDVVVVGGGPGGITAAIAAARSGAKTLLIEEDLVLGGALTDYYVAMLCGKPTQGILLEILQECIQKYRLQRGINWFMPASWIKAIANITAKEPNLTVMTGAKLVDVETCGDKIKSVIVLCESVMRRISGKVFLQPIKQFSAETNIGIIGTGFRLYLSSHWRSFLSLHFLFDAVVHLWIWN